jgi:hypothetical protein
MYPGNTVMPPVNKTLYFNIYYYPSTMLFKLPGLGELAEDGLSPAEIREQISILTTTKTLVSDQLEQLRSLDKDDSSTIAIVLPSDLFLSQFNALAERNENVRVVVGNIRRMVAEIRQLSQEHNS